MKNSNHNLFEAVEKQHYKKKYLERKLDERTADEEIRTFTYRSTGEVSETPSLDEEGHLRTVLR